MDERWESVYGQVDKGPNFFKFVIWLKLKNGLTIHRAKVIPIYKFSDTDGRVDIYAFTLNTIVRELDEHLDGRV